MRLTKYQKEAIVRSIMNDVPKANDAVTRKEMQDAVVKAMSPEVRKVYKSKPKALRTERAASWNYELDYGFDVIAGDVDLEVVLKPWRDKKAAKENAQRKLKAVVDGCSTLKQLKQALPEFDSYFPTEVEPTKNLPALANVVADLSKLGWPKK